MMRNLLLTGVIVGSTVSVPLIFQANPVAFQRALDRTFPSRSTPVGQVAAPAPATPARAETVGLEGLKVRVTPDARGHFVGTFRINGRSVDAMVDTGATLVAINQSTARRIGISLKASDFIYKVNTANGEARAAPATIDRVQIGRITIDKVEAVVLDDSSLKDTLVGMSFLKRLGRYTVQDNQLILQQ